LAPQIDFTVAVDGQPDLEDVLTKMTSLGAKLKEIAYKRAFVVDQELKFGEVQKTLLKAAGVLLERAFKSFSNLYTRLELL
jgi:hypothetical protein